jgi:hypothetical protein
MQFTEIALEAIEPSESNPRRRRNPAAEAELMASVSTYGILTPLLVRPYQSSKPETMLALAHLYGIDVKTMRDELNSQTKSPNQPSNSRKHHKAA